MQPRGNTHLILIFVFLFVGNHLFSANLQKDSTSRTTRIYSTLKISKSPVIDGALTDSCWQKGEWQTNYTQFIPIYNGKPSRKTDLKILYDDKNMYVAIRAYDDMNLVTKRLTRRDVFAGDIVGVHFDSYFDKKTAFEFDITSAGQKLDLWVANDGWDLNWNAVWEGKVAHEDSAWTAEFKIPLSQLRYGASSEQVWGVNSWRKIDRFQEEDHWKLVANDGTGIVYTFGELHGLKDLKRNRRMELVPYLSGKATNFNTQTNWEGRAGLDAKIGITNNFTLDATINPDFGQVEADPSVMNLTAFETYFEEKRPFFVEGKSIFDFTFDKDMMFYTRRIGHSPSFIPQNQIVSMPENTAIGGAFKLSGKTSGGLSFGLMESLAMNESADVLINNERKKLRVEPLTNYFVGRFQKDFNKGNTTLGAIITQTHRFIKDDYLNFLSDDATTYGLDFTKYWKERKYFIELKTIGSNINGDKESVTRLQTSSARYFQRPDINKINFDTTKTSLNGLGASFKIGKWSKGHWRYNEELVYKSPGLELNDLGYMNISNVIKNTSNIAYFETNNQWVLKNYTVSFAQQNAWNNGLEGLYSLASLNAETEFTNSWYTKFTAQYTFRTTDERLLRGGPAMKIPNLMEYVWYLRTNSSKKWYASISLNRNQRAQGNSYANGISSEFSYQLLSNLSLSVQPSFSKNVDDLQYVDQFGAGSSQKKYLLGRVDNRNLGVTFRVDFTISPELTIQYYASPFVSIGKYSNFKEVSNPKDNVYGNRFKNLVPVQNASALQFDSNNDGTFDYSIQQPDFNYQQFKSNLVLRWEYKTGSTLYLVWAQDRTTFGSAEAFNFSQSFKNVFSISPRNILMLKLNYWLPVF